jgi:hypothetical protein
MKKSGRACISTATARAAISPGEHRAFSMLAYVWRGTRDAETSASFGAFGINILEQPKHAETGASSASRLRVRCIRQSRCIQYQFGEWSRSPAPKWRLETATEHQ